MRYACKGDIYLKTVAYFAAHAIIETSIKKCSILSSALNYWTTTPGKASNNGYGLEISRNSYPNITLSG